MGCGAGGSGLDGSAMALFDRRMLTGKGMTYIAKIASAQPFFRGEFDQLDRRIRITLLAGLSGPERRVSCTGPGSAGFAVRAEIDGAAAPSLGIACFRGKPSRMLRQFAGAYPILAQN